MSIEVVKLNYVLDGLEPFISKKALDFHYNKHYQNYVNTTNVLIKDTVFEDKSLLEIVRSSTGAIFNNAAQAFNHAFFFNCLVPNNKTVEIPVTLQNLIVKYFGSVDEFNNKFIQAATSNFGSGWTWLVQNNLDKGLSIINTSNAGTPITKDFNVLLCVDVWEHAYYLDYQNLRKDYVTEFMKHIDWNFVTSNLK